MTAPHQRVVSNELTTKLAAHGFIAPSYHDYSLASVLPAAAAALGFEDALSPTAPTSGGPERARHAAQQLGLKQVDRVCVVLIDGLGLNNLKENPESAPFLTSLLESSAPGLSGFPSTTAASMGTFGTGSSTGQTSMVGYSAINPQTGELGNFVSWKGLGDPLKIQRHPVIFDQLSRAGANVTSVSLGRFAHSGMTQAALRGATYRSADSLTEHVDIAAFELGQPGLVHLYWGEVDKIGHHQGTNSSQWRTALAKADYEISRLYQSLPPATALIVTADHGMINTDPAKLIDISNHYGLSQGVQAIAGEPRASHVYLNSPGSASQVAKRWTQELGDKALVLTKDQAVGGGLFGTATKYTQTWIGDLVVMMTGTGIIADTTTATPASLRLLGVHGSLTPTEVEIPLLVAQT